MALASSSPSPLEGIGIGTGPGSGVATGAGTRGNGDENALSTEGLTPPSPISPRFTLELEFVLCLSNPQYLQYLAVTYPTLLNDSSTPSSASNKAKSQATPSAKSRRGLSRTAHPSEQDDVMNLDDSEAGDDVDVEENDDNVNDNDGYGDENNSNSNSDSDAARFARYLAYLYSYWRLPTYSKYLTHPGAVLRNLELLQNPRFRADVIRPDVVAKLFETGLPLDQKQGQR